MKAVERDALVFRKTNGSPGRGGKSPGPKQQDPLYALLNNFAFQAKEIKRWETDKSAKLAVQLRGKKGPPKMPVGDCRELFDMNFPGTGEVNP